MSIALLHGDIHPSTNAETKELCRGLARLVADPAVKRWKDLQRLTAGVSYWAYDSMPEALRGELKRNDLSALSKRRLLDALESMDYRLRDSRKK